MFNLNYFILSTYIILHNDSLLIVLEGNTFINIWIIVIKKFKKKKFFYREIKQLKMCLKL